METYEEFINNIFETRGRFSCGNTYHERHHIKPKCLGGTDDEDNLIDLFAREHFIAHKLLAQENPENNSLVYAWSCMAFIHSTVQERCELTPEEYEEARIALSEARKGKLHSEETKRKISEKAKERYKDPKYCEKMRQTYIDRYTDEVRQKMKRDVAGKNNPMYGKHHTEESNAQMSEAHKETHAGEKNPMYGRPWWDENTPQEKIDEWLKHKSEASSGSNNPNYGVKCTEEKRNKLIQNNPNIKAIAHIDQNHQIIEQYRSIREAGRKTGINRQLLVAYCNGKQKPKDGTSWIYVE